MSTHPQVPATTVRRAIVVDAPVERAFRVFTEDFDRIKPREHNMLGVEIAENAVGGADGWPLHLQRFGAVVDEDS